MDKSDKGKNKGDIIFGGKMGSLAEIRRRLEIDNRSRKCKGFENTGIRRND